MVHFASATLRFDGACKSNPGEGGAGYVVFDNRNGNNILEGQYYIGYDCTNNVAEYAGLITALKELRNSPHSISHLDIEGDSQLVINQMNGIYNVSGKLHHLHLKATELVSKCRGHKVNTYTFRYIPREENFEADKLANSAIREKRDSAVDYYRNW